MNLVKTYVVEDCLRAYNLSSSTQYNTFSDGSGDVSISDEGIWTGGCGFLSSAWDNTGNWKLECEVMFKRNAGGGIGLCATTLTSRWYNRMFKLNASGSCVYINNSTSDNNIGSFSTPTLNTWLPLVITRNNGLISFIFDNKTKSSSGWNYRNDSTMSFGTDQWSNGDGISFKNLRIKPL